jgi:hypothetical protein
MCGAEEHEPWCGMEVSGIAINSAGVVVADRGGRLYCKQQAR